MAGAITPFSAARVVLGGATLASYPEGGGHWSARLQYLHGLGALGHDVFWLEILPSTGDEARDRSFVATFVRRMKRYGFAGRFAVLRLPQGSPHDLDRGEVFGIERHRLQEICRNADFFWNFCGHVAPPLLCEFRHPALIDLDPGLLHVSALTWDLHLGQHRSLLTVGSNLNEADCLAPGFGLVWQPFRPPVFLPLWAAGPDPGPHAPITTVSHWTWGRELELDGRLISTSKRDAYLRYAGLASGLGRPMELAVKLPPSDATGDRALLLDNGWSIVDPHRVARSPAAYRSYIAASRAELSLPKPVFRDLRTGWFSDRSAAYLASGRPVLAEDTGFSHHLPVGDGLVTFATVPEARDAIASVDANWTRHAKAARALAEEYLDAERVLTSMLEHCAESRRSVPRECHAAIGGVSR